MDPVSVVGLLGSIESIAEGAFKLVAFINTIREGGKQRLRLFTELISLWIVLVLLGARLKSEEEEISEAWLKTIAVLDEDDSILDQIQAAFDNLTSRLQPKTGHCKILQTLRWPFDKSEFEALVARLERLKSSLDLAMNSTDGAVIREIQNDTKAMRLNVANDEDDFIKQARAGTGEWFLERDDFQTWASSEEAMLWLEYLKQYGKEKNVAVLVIYCGYNEAKSQSIDNLIAALIKQILQLRPDVSKELKELYKIHSRTEVFPSLQDLTRILRAELGKFDNCYIIVDALDEILEESNRQLLLETLVHGKVNIMVTSRPLDKIGELFGLYTETTCDGCEEGNLRILYHCKQCMGSGFDLCEACNGKDMTCPQEGHYIIKQFGTREIEIEATESDVRNYVQWRVDHEPKLLDSVTKKRALREEIALTIVQQANGMFLLAKLHMDSLATKRTPRAVQEALQNLPAKIGDTYDQAMQRIEATNDDDRKIFVAEVEHASSISANATDIDEDEVLSASNLTSMCAGLVIIDASDVVRLVLFSAQNYFREDREKWFSNGHKSLARDCLTYLSFQAFESGACSGPTESDDFKQRSLQYPLLEYSCSYWGRHASRMASQGDLTDEIVAFLNKKPQLGASVQALWYSDSADVADWDVRSGVHPLHLAAYFGLNRVVLRLLSAGAIVDCRDSSRTTPLMYAASGGHASVVQALLREGANPNLLCDRSSSALHRAIASNRVDVARVLLDHPDIDINVLDTSRNDQTPLMLAASLRRSTMIPILLHRPGPDVNLQSGSYSSTALTLAASSGDAHIVRQILAHPDIEVNKKNRWNTALTEGARDGSRSVVEALLDHGADLEIQEGIDSPSGTPLNRAIDYGYVSVVRLLLQRGANPKVLDAYKRTVIHSAAVNGRDDVLRVLFEQSTCADVNAQGNNGRTALHDAAYFNFCSTINILFENGARTDIHDDMNRSPLGVAKDNNNLNALSLLQKPRKEESHRDESIGRLKHTNTSIDNKEADFLKATKLGMIETVQSFIKLSRTDPTIDLDLVDLDRHSALHLAVQGEHTQILQLLVDAGANVNTLDRLERTPLHWCALDQNYSAAECLLDAGADVELKDHYEETALHIALSNPNSALTVLLLEHGAIPPDTRLQAALFAAAQWGSADLVKRLVEAGADPLKKDNYGSSPFHYAQSGENEEAAKMILKLCEERETGGSGQQKKLS